MESKALVLWFWQLIIIGTSAQKLHNDSHKSHGICGSVFCKSIKCLDSLNDCVVIMGNLELVLFERTTRDNFMDLSFPKLREITEYFVAYRVQGLESLGTLFPNLARIRGEQLKYNYALVVFDLANLIEIGLYNLIQIDRGDIVLYSLPQACYMHTINWKLIAPAARHVIEITSTTDTPICSKVCSCSRDVNVNHCWNNRKCQRILEGPEGESCNEQCLGCLKTNSNICTVCRHYTYESKCVSQCPNGTLVLLSNQYCITLEECKELDGWAWNSSCIFECPVDYVMQNESNDTTCKHCPECYHTCKGQVIHSVESMQAAERCVFINGSLVIHLGMITEAMNKLRTYLKRIQEVSDYILIYRSNVITSLDFLSSLRHIKGKKLRHDRYSLVVYDMFNLHSMFESNVTKELKIERGTLTIFNNPMLCMNHIDKIKHLFPEKPNEMDIPTGTNGYGRGCEEESLNIQVRVLNETSAIIMFLPKDDPDIYYSLLYVKLPIGFNGTIVPESCGTSEWYVENIPNTFGHNGLAELSSLHPASTYAFCMEMYDSTHQRITRSSTHNFTTHVGVPKPPFLVELVASSFDVVVIHWLDHKDYRPHITRYELDVFLINSNDEVSIDYCKYVIHDFTNLDYARHAVVMKPPPEYGKTCESKCGVLSSFTPGALEEDYFDVCSELASDCANQIDIPPSNSSFKQHIGTLSLNISTTKKSFQVGNLAPFRDYKFKLRSCIGNVCSRSAKGVVRTLRSPTADVPKMVSVFADSIGHITVKWEPPEVTNGPILTYIVEVLPKLENIELVVPQAWCLLANTTNFVAATVSATKYKVRVCSKTLVSVNTCSEWKVIEATSKESVSWLWLGVIFGFLLYLTSMLVGFLWRTRRVQSDLDPLVESVTD